MSTQAEIDLEARIGELERQLAELSAKVNPLYSGGMDRYIHSGYLQWDGINLRLDKNGIQLPADGVNRSILFFLQELAADPTAVLRKSQLIGNVSDSAANIIMAAATSGASVSAAVQANASSFLTYWTASMGGNVYQMDFQASSGSDWGLLTLTKGYLRIVGGSSDPAGAGDGSIWYNTTTDKLYARINGATVELGGGGGMSLIVKEADETVLNSTTLQDDDELLFAVAANEVWQFEGVLIVNAHPAPDIKLTFTGPTGAVGSYGLISQDTSNNTVVGAAALGNATGIATAAQLKAIRFWGGIHNGSTAGSLKLQWAQNTADAGTNIYVQAGSYIKYMKET